MNSSQSRRQFLQGSAAIFLTAAASHTKLNEAQSISSNSEENYWSIVRSQFAQSCRYQEGHKKGLGDPGAGETCR